MLAKADETKNIAKNNTAVNNNLEFFQKFVRELFHSS